MEKLSAQYAVSINDAKQVISSWMGDDDDDGNDEQNDMNFKPLQPSKGLGATPDDRDYKTNQRPVLDNSFKALNSIKKRKERESKAHGHKDKVEKQHSDSEEEETRSSISSKKSASNTSFDLYRKKKSKKSSK